MFMNSWTILLNLPNLVAERLLFGNAVAILSIVRIDLLMPFIGNNAAYECCLVNKIS